MAKSKRLRQISHQEADFGIYIDFEGTATDPSSFVGILYKRDDKLLWEQVVFEETLRPVVANYKTDTHPSSDACSDAWLRFLHRCAVEL